MPQRVFEEARGQRVPVYLWARDASEDTLRQLVNIASRPYVVHSGSRERRLAPIAVLKG
jgi:Tat protein secretion system quality control protein TatD with DNase activity